MGGSGNGSSFHMARAPPAFPWMNLPATSILQRDSSSSNPLDPRGVGCSWLSPCSSFLHSVLLESEVNAHSFSGWLHLPDKPFQG